MPTYAYRCTVCQHAFDVHQGFHDDPLTVCPQCEGRLRKVFSPVGVVFKGSGFYRTDARGSSSASSPAAKQSSTGSESTGSDKAAGEGTPAKSPASSDSSSTSAAPSPKQPAATAS